MAQQLLDEAIRHKLALPHEDLLAHLVAQHSQGPQSTALQQTLDLLSIHIAKSKLSYKSTVEDIKLLGNQRQQLQRQNVQLVQECKEQLSAEKRNAEFQRKVGMYNSMLAGIPGEKQKKEMEQRLKQVQTRALQIDADYQRQKARYSKKKQLVNILMNLLTDLSEP